MTTTRYVTVVATLEVPNDTVWPQVIRSRVAGLMEELGLPLAPCDWTPNVGALTDGLGAEHGTVAVLDLNPPREHIEDGGRQLTP
jgi:hypothetical protein